MAAKPVGTNGLLAVSPNTRIVMPATEPYEARPRRKRAMVTLHTAQSFATYVADNTPGSYFRLPPMPDDYFRLPIVFPGRPAGWVCIPKNLTRAEAARIGAMLEAVATDRPEPEAPRG